LAYVGITRAKKKALVSFAMNRFYQGNWIDSMASRFIDELPEKYLDKNSFFDESKNDDNDFEFNQDFVIVEGNGRPGWIRYQKRIK
jgi:DNA helicase-2/ATP-dependent DNA helicase PcrA